VLFGPVRVALITWQNMVKPELAVALSENRNEAVAAQIKRTLTMMGLAVIVLGIGLMVMWPWVNDILYAKKYADQPMRLIVLMWAAITFFAAIYNAPAAALQALKDFRVLAMSSVYGALISAVMVSVLLYFTAPELTLLGIMAAEAFMAVYLLRIVFNRLKTAP